MTAPSTTTTSDFVNDFVYVDPNNPFHTLNNSQYLIHRAIFHD